jgi:hypothetical protein
MFVLHTVVHGVCVCVCVCVCFVMGLHNVFGSTQNWKHSHGVNSSSQFIMVVVR